MNRSRRRLTAWRDHWVTSPRSPRPEEAEHLARFLAEAQPRFWAAAVADARITARFRGEHHTFGSRGDALGQIARLAWVTDSFFAQLCYRAAVHCRVRRVPVLPSVLHHLAVTTAQINIGPKVVVGPGVYIPHGQVVIDGLTALGDGVVLRPFVTIGLKDGWVVGPRIGARTRVGTGAKVFGPVVIGHDVQVGANAVVVSDVPARRRAVGVPARVLPARAAGSGDS